MVNQGKPISELIFGIKNLIEGAYRSPEWVVAEISEISVNRSGHCYLELIEKDTISDKVKVKIRATIWSFAYRTIQPYFKSVTGENLAPGMKVLFCVNVSFHEQYGISLNIVDVDPAFTLGDYARRRAEIITALEADGVFDQNKMLELPLVLQNIAVISSATAAGYQDFVHQLQNNEAGYDFQVSLFEAVMQGEQTAASVIDALNEIHNSNVTFDAVVIIRGGGSKIELSSFDNYDLAYYITQFPLPILSGIGHERDETIVDLVAHTRLKTPTAVAEFIIEKAGIVNTILYDFAFRLRSSGMNYLQQQQIRQQTFVSSLLLDTRALLDSQLKVLENSRVQLVSQTQSYLFNNLNKTERVAQRIKNSLTRRLLQEELQLTESLKKLKIMPLKYLRETGKSIEMNEQRLRLLDPEEVLKRGFALVKKGNRYMGSASLLEKGQDLELQFHDGVSQVKVLQISSQSKANNE